MLREALKWATMTDAETKTLLDSFRLNYMDYGSICESASKIIISKKPEPFTPKKIIRSGPMTIIFWDDGTKTLVRRAEGAEDDPYLAFCAGLAKKMYGNNTRVKKLITEKTVETKKKEEKDHD